VVMQRIMRLLIGMDFLQRVRMETVQIKTDAVVMKYTLMPAMVGWFVVRLVVKIAFHRLNKKNRHSAVFYKIDLNKMYKEKING